MKISSSKSPFKKAVEISNFIMCILYATTIANIALILSYFTTIAFTSSKSILPFENNLYKLLLLLFLNLGIIFLSSNVNIYNIHQYCRCLQSSTTPIGVEIMFSPIDCLLASIEL